MAPKHCHTSHAGFGKGGGEREGFSFELGTEGALAVAQVGKPCGSVFASFHQPVSVPAMSYFGRGLVERGASTNPRVEEEPAHFLPLRDSLSFKV